jgi:hypothetical protein
MSGALQLVLAVVTQVAVVGLLFVWMFRKDHRLKRERLARVGRRNGHGA